MKIAEYAGHDATGLAELVARKQVTPKELAQSAAAAIAAANPKVNAVVELYQDRIEVPGRARRGSPRRPRVGSCRRR